MNSITVPPSATPYGLLALSAAASALWVEHSSRQAERRHHAPHDHLYIDGNRLHYQLVGEGPDVLLLHGNLVHGADWQASGLVDRLSRQYRVLVVDRPGFGHSDRLRGRVWTPAEQARLVHRAASALGLRRPVVVGHSLGTQLALCMALQTPADVAGLVLVSGYYWPSVRVDRWLAAPAALPVLGDVLRYTTAAWTARATLDGAIKGMFDPAPVPEAFRRLLPRELLLRPLQQRSTAEDGNRMVPQARVLARQYPGLQLPVTVIAGAEDRIVSPQQSRRLHEALPQSRFRLLAGVGHMAHYGAHEQIATGIAEAVSATA
ncbi:MAG TPA: alpha/beta hydrolase [Ramlibacter sp.]|nr:alpha/beta hydrolase [Ramlibacter sp.]